MRPMKKTLYVCWFALSCLIWSCGTTKGSFDPDQKYSPAQLQRDYGLFRHILEDLHPSLYWYQPKDSMNYYFDQGYAQLNDSMTEPAFRTLLSYIIAKVDCGHTSVRSSRAYSRFLDTNRLAMFPLVIKFWKDTAVIAANLNRRDSVLRRGVILQSIDGKPISRIKDSLFQYIVTDGYNQTGKYQYLSTGLNFGFWYRNIFSRYGPYRIGYLDGSGYLREAILPLYDPRSDSTRRLPDHPFVAGPKGQGGGVHHPHKKDRPLSERLQSRNMVLDSATNTAFMTLNTFEGGYGLGRFFRKSFRELHQKHIANLVIDVRSNGGGDASNSTLLTRFLIDKKFKIADSLYTLRRHSKYDRYIKKSFIYGILMDLVTHKEQDGYYHFGYFERHYFRPRHNNHFDGPVYILTGGNSFSATSLFAGALKGQKNIKLVGEETGGGYYGNTAWMIPDVVLPETGIQFRLPRFHLVVDKTRLKNGLGVLPDEPALPSVEAIRQGVDFKTARAKELIRLQAANK